MRIRESGMPPEDYWNSFFDPGRILLELEIDNLIKDAAEFGSGYGTFSIPAAKIIGGTLYAIDISDEMIEIVNTKLLRDDVNNIKLVKRDFVKDGTGLENNSIDYIMMFNILHAEEPEKLLDEAKRILTHNGKLGIIHWIYSDRTPRGPSMRIRPKEEQIIEWLKAAGFGISKGPLKLPPYHYGIVAVKK